MNWKEVIEDFEGQIRAGQGAVVKKQLNEIGFSNIPRNQFSALANIAVRVGAAAFALKLLGREVKKSNFRDSGLDLNERVEYAGALSSIGAYPEARRILADLDGSKAPKVFLYNAFAHFNEWNYFDAIPMLEKFIQLTDSEYQNRVGRVNLCAALVYCNDLESALGKLEGLGAELQRDKQFFLFGNVLELKAQCFLGMKNFKQCEKVLVESEKLLSSTGSFSEMFTKKWFAVSQLMQSNPEGRELLKAVEKMARSANHYETLRECDFFQGVYCAEDSLLKKVYFGSPFSSYRKKISRTAKNFEPGTDSYDWQVGTDTDSLDEKPRLIKRLDGRNPIGDIEPDAALHNLQKLLFSDFYAPWRIGTLFSRLFPEEHYDVQSSPNRIYQLIHRLNEAAVEASLPVRFESDGYGFRVTSKSHFQITVSAFTEIQNRLGSQILLLKENFGLEVFNSRQAQTLLGKSQSQVSEILAEARSKGLKKTGGGRATKYFFAA